MNPRARPIGLLAAAILVAAPVARAGSAEAEAAFRAGRKAMEAGDYTTACASFAESERLEPAPGTLLNLADCEDHSGHLVAAHEHFGLAASGFVRGDVRRTIAMQRAANLDRRVVRLALRLVPTAPAGTVVHDGDAVLTAPTLGAVRLVDPGLHVVIVAAAGHEDRPYALTLKEGDQVEQTLDVGEVRAASAPHPQGAVAPAAVPLGPAVAPAPAEPGVAPPPETGGGGRTVGWVLGSAGVAGIALGAVTGVLALDRAATVKSHCPGEACDPQGLDAASQGKWLAPTSTVAFIAGGALLAAGAYFVFFGRSPSSGVALAPTAGPGRAGAALSGEF